MYIYICIYIIFYYYILDNLILLKKVLLNSNESCFYRIYTAVDCHEKTKRKYRHKI